MEDEVPSIRRPPAPLRITIVVTELANTPATPANQAPTNAMQPASQAPVPPDAAPAPKKPEPGYFNATKAPGGMYR